MTDDEHRLKNFLMFKMYLTDKEVEKFAPYMALFIIVLVGGFFLFAWLSK